MEKANELKETKRWKKVLKRVVIQASCSATERSVDPCFTKLWIGYNEGKKDSSELSRDIENICYASMFFCSKTMEIKQGTLQNNFQRTYTCSTIIIGSSAQRGLR